MLPRSGCSSHAWLKRPLPVCAQQVKSIGFAGRSSDSAGEMRQKISFITGQEQQRRSRKCGIIIFIERRRRPLV